MLAHVDPGGDGGPSVAVEDGNFVIRFNSKTQQDSNERSAWRMDFTPDGKVLLPRHRVPPELQRPRYIYTEHGEPVKVISQREKTGGKSRFVFHQTKNGQSAVRPLPIEPVQDVWVQKTTLFGDQIGFTWANAHEPVRLMFSTASTKGFVPGITVFIGECASIYDFPTASNPVWAAQRWWVAWVRAAQTEEERKDPLRAWQMMLSSFDPTTKKLEHKTVPGLSNWNTSISMKTTGDWLCIAWNASIDGRYPGIAKIVTAFEMLPGP